MADPADSTISDVERESFEDAMYDLKTASNALKSSMECIELLAASYLNGEGGITASAAASLFASSLPYVSESVAQHIDPHTLQLVASITEAGRRQTDAAIAAAVEAARGEAAKAIERIRTEAAVAIQAARAEASAAIESSRLPLASDMQWTQTDPTSPKRTCMRADAATSPVVFHSKRIDTGCGDGFLADTVLQSTQTSPSHRAQYSQFAAQTSPISAAQAAAQTSPRAVADYLTSSVPRDSPTDGVDLFDANVGDSVRPLDRATSIALPLASPSPFASTTTAPAEGAVLYNASTYNASAAAAAAASSFAPRGAPPNPSVDSVHLPMPAHAHSPPPTSPTPTPAAGGARLGRVVGLGRRRPQAEPGVSLVSDQFDRSSPPRDVLSPGRHLLHADPVAVAVPHGGGEAHPARRRGDYEGTGRSYCGAGGAWEHVSSGASPSPAGRHVGRDTRSHALAGGAATRARSGGRDDTPDDPSASARRAMYEQSLRVAMVAAVANASVSGSRGASPRDMHIAGTRHSPTPAFRGVVFGDDSVMFVGHDAPIPKDRKARSRYYDPVPAHGRAGRSSLSGKPLSRSSGQPRNTLWRAGGGGDYDDYDDDDNEHEGDLSDDDVDRHGGGPYGPPATPDRGRAASAPRRAPNEVSRVRDSLISHRTGRVDVLRGALRHERHANRVHDADVEDDLSVYDDDDGDDDDESYAGSPLMRRASPHHSRGMSPRTHLATRAGLVPPRRSMDTAKARHPTAAIPAGAEVGRPDPAQRALDTFNSHTRSSHSPPGVRGRTGHAATSASSFSVPGTAQRLPARSRSAGVSRRSVSQQRAKHVPHMVNSGTFAKAAAVPSTGVESPYTPVRARYTPTELWNAFEREKRRGPFDNAAAQLRARTTAPAPQPSAATTATGQAAIAPSMSSLVPSGHAAASMSTALTPPPDLHPQGRIAHASSSPLHPTRDVHSPTPTSLPRAPHPRAPHPTPATLLQPPAATVAAAVAPTQPTATSIRAGSSVAASARNPGPSVVATGDVAPARSPLGAAHGGHHERWDWGADGESVPRHGRAPAVRALGVDRSPVMFNRPSLFTQVLTHYHVPGRDGGKSGEWALTAAAQRWLTAGPTGRVAWDGVVAGFQAAGVDVGGTSGVTPALLDSFSGEVSVGGTAPVTGDGFVTPSYLLFRGDTSGASPRQLLSIPFGKVAGMTVTDSGIFTGAAHLVLTDGGSVDIRVFGAAIPLIFS